MKTKLLGRTPEELKQIALEAGLPAFAGKQMAQWLYQKRVKSIDEMTNLSKQGREALAQRYEVGITDPVDVQTSKDGTKKYLFPVRCPVGAGHDGKGHEEDSFVEAVMIPDEDRKTLCVSSQAGCKMGCKFCMTGRQGFHGNLSAADIMGQFFAIEEAGELTNAVFMGMGEPLDNWDEVKRAIDILTADWGLAWSPKRITLSTIGVLPKLKLFLEESKCHLAVSLHNPFPEERAELMPVQKAWSLTEIVRLIKQYDFTGQRRVSFEYTVFEGWNDTPRHADELIKLLRHLECRVNLIRFHRIPDFPYGPASVEKMEAFRNRLNEGGLTATIRASRGEDIFAACGLLAGKHSEQ
ncbi:MAG: 23S rRNA (adenine(2503)-C(2))-methyltransferase RlmN [Bacteroidales bacterium]|nr:23S rRNA (adenine(2503)-C(2))-methyltransferase RlmN [Bacteroidales bacterium]